ncbi:hypothetical protein CBS101457_002304 [Exobasidium rhododendri]|nr:hypothetical protein CBS101457_002304 [Exobasidium rhododendri]
MEAVPLLVSSTPQLEESLAHVENASLMYSSPDSATREQGAAIFLQFRQSPEAVLLACFAIARTNDTTVLFQAFQAMLDYLPNIPLESHDSEVSSLQTLRDFVLDVIIARSALESTKHLRLAKSSNSSLESWTERRSHWPVYARKRAYLAFAAIEKRMIGLEVEAENQPNGAIQQAIERHTLFFTNHIATLFALPEAWPNDERKSLLTKSYFEAGVGLMNALLDETSTTHARLDSDGNNRGKSRGVDYSGLLPMQHRWCKAIIQTYVLPSLLATSSKSLYSTLPGQVHANQTFLFPLLVSLLERMLGWIFVVEEPFAGLRGPLTVERQTQLLKNDETKDSEDDDDEDDNDDKRAEARSSGMIKTSFRLIPNSHGNFFSREVISVLHLAYGYAKELESRNFREASYCIVAIEKSMLEVASYRLTIQSEADRQLIGVSRQSQMDCIIAIVTKTCIEKESNEVKRSLNLYGNSLLFCSQLFLNLLTSSDDKSMLYQFIDLGRLLETLNVLSDAIFTFALVPSTDFLEEDELIQLGDEAVNNVLSCWRSTLPYSYEGASGEAAEVIKRAVYHGAVRPYIHHRLLSAGSASEEDVNQDASEHGQESESDHVKYEGQLVLLASLARDSDLDSCISYLLEVNSPVSQQLSQFYSSADAPSFLSQQDTAVVEGLWEQTHWITLISGHVLADHSRGEVASIASEIVALGAERQSSVVQLIQSLSFTLLEPYSKPSIQVRSPLVVETLLWFNARWIPTYLLINTTPIFTAHFGGETGKEMLQYLLVRLQGVVGVWRADADVVFQLAAVIKSLSLSEGVMHILLGLVDFQNTVKTLTEGLDVLPAKTHGPLISSVVGCIYTSSPTQSPELFFEYIKQAVESRLSRVIHQDGFATVQVSQRSDVIISLLNVLDMIDGLASSIQPKSARAVYDFISRFFDTMVSLIRLYSERAEIVIAVVRVYRTLIGSLDVGFGADPQMIVGLNSAVFALVNSLNERNLLGSDMEAAMEEEVPFEGLCLLMESLLDLMLASENDAVDPRQWFKPFSVEYTSDVCLQAFSHTIAMLNTEARSVARVRKRFATLTSKLWISFPHRIVGILVSPHAHGDAHLFQRCISALEISLRFVESNLVLDCFEAVRVLCMAVEKILNMTTSVLSPSLSEVIERSLLSISSTLLRGVLIDPLATSLLDVHLLTMRSSMQSLANEKLGGISRLETKMDEFCLTTSLLSEHRSNSSTFQENSNLRPEEENRKREALKAAVRELRDRCFKGERASIHSSQGREEESEFLKEARVAAWLGRSRIRAG